MITLGIIVSSFFSHEGTDTLNPGESMNVGNYEFVYEEMVVKQDSLKVSAISSIAVMKNGRTITTLKPSYDYWFRNKNSFAEVAVRSTPVRDIFVSLIWTDYTSQDKKATFRVLVNPLILWIWVGGGLFLLGGALSFSAYGRKQPPEE
jgi:cytochrome c-type biogenesis protein CcmF